MQVEVEGIEDIPVVKEFPEVFHIEIKVLPPKLEGEFTIDIVSRAGPISKAL